MSTSIPRILGLTLLLSVAMNLVLGGWLLMRAPWRGQEAPRARHAALPHLADLRAFRQVLPEARQASVDRSFEQHRAAMRQRIGALFAARRAVREAMRSEPFQRAALDAAFAALRRAESDAAESAQALMADVFESATPAERAALAELVPRHGRGHTRSRESERSPHELDPARQSAEP